MHIHTHLEDLSNEIFFEIFDYLDAFDIFTSFTSLNQRISSILEFIPLRVIISQNYFRRQIDFLFSYLTFHAHQVISLTIHDTILDYSSVISLLFNRHHFINLQSCVFHSFNSSTKLKNVIKQIQNLDKLVTFSLFEPSYISINEEDKCDLTRMILMHKSSSLRTMVLQHCYDYFDILNYTSISSNLTSLHLRIYGTSLNVSLLSFVYSFRIFHGIRHLGLKLEDKYSVENNNVNAPNPVLSHNDHPIFPKVISFHLILFAMCDIYSIGHILNLMPNLNRFNFGLAVPMAASPYYRELFNGYVWEGILKRSAPCLSKFEFHMQITKSISTLNLDYIVKSFEYFVRKYPNWNMVIDRWRLVGETPEEFVMLHTLHYCKSNVKIFLPCIISESYETRSTTTINDHHLFYSNITTLRIYMTKKRPIVTSSPPLYKNIDKLFVQVPIISYSSLWNKFLNTVIFRQTTDDDDDAQQNATCLEYFLDLSNITELEFASDFQIYQWKRIQFILQACPNVTDVTIGTRLLMLTKLIDNPSLIPIFKHIKMIISITEKFYFPPNFALKLIQRFPSLTEIELQAFSFDNCVSIINLFLTYLKNLIYVRINYSQDTLLADPFSRDYIIEKRRQNFPDNIIDEEKVNVKTNGEVITIWLM